MKRDGSVRICGDYRITVNLACPVDSYPLPRIEELLANLAGGNCFSKLDMSQVHLQLPLDNDSTELVTVNTYKGLFKYNRLPFVPWLRPPRPFISDVWRACCRALKESRFTLTISS